MTPPMNEDIKRLVEAARQAEPLLDRACCRGGCMCPVGSCKASSLRDALASLATKETDRG